MFGTVGKYYLHRITGHSGLFWPIFPLFLLGRGVTFTGIGTLLAVQAGTTLVAEVPTGYVGDHIGRRNSLVAGSLLVAFAELGFVLSGGFVGFVAVYVTYGLGRALRSGSGDAWLYDVLGTRNRATEFTRIRGRGESATHWASALCMLASGGLYVLDPTYPFIAAAGLTFVNAAVLTSFPVVSVGADDTTGISLGGIRPVIGETLRSRTLRTVVVTATAFFAVERAITEFIPSVTMSVVDTSNLLDGIVSDPTVVQVFSVGVLFALLTATSAVAGSFAGRVERTVGAVYGLLLASSISAAFLAGAAVAAEIAVVGFVLTKTADALARPLVIGHVNEHLQTAGRATILSVLSMGFTLTQLPVLVGVGGLADYTTVLTVVTALGVGFLVVVGATALSRYRPHRVDSTR